MSEVNDALAELNATGWTLCYAWQDGNLFRVNLRKQNDGHDLIRGGVSHDFEHALSEAMDATAERIDAEAKVQSWIMAPTESSLAARLGIGQHAPITRRF